VRFFALDELPPYTFPEHVHRIQDARRSGERALLRVAAGPSSRDVARGLVDLP
jgi:hypothetical protein